jgi:hypothetical protein
MHLSPAYWNPVYLPKPTPAPERHPPIGMTDWPTGQNGSPSDVSSGGSLLQTSPVLCERYAVKIPLSPPPEKIRNAAVGMPTEMPAPQTIHQPQPHQRQQNLL